MAHLIMIFIIYFPDKEDFPEIVEKMKTNKGPEEDFLISEFFKKGGEVLHSQLYSLIYDIWDKERMGY